MYGVLPLYYRSNIITYDLLHLSSSTFKNCTLHHIPAFALYPSTTENQFALLFQELRKNICAVKMSTENTNTQNMWQRLKGHSMIAVVSAFVLKNKIPQETVTEFKTHKNNYLSFG